MDKTHIIIRKSQPEDAQTVARLIMVAMREECCRHFYGEGHTSEEFHEMMTELVSRRQTQYSYENTICAVDDGGKVVGCLVAYDGGRLHELRRAFVSEVLRRFGRDFSRMDDETEAGELYVDSLAVEACCRGRGIATRLFAAAEDRARRLSIARLGLLMEPDNTTAERLYLRQGFLPVGWKQWGGHQLKHLQKKL